MKVALGRNGIRANKREGDGGTPHGRFHPVRLWWRSDRLLRPQTLLPVRRIADHDAWCEDPADRRYNRPFRRSASEPGDRLRRGDALYDLIVEIDHNTRPRVAGRGSAVFIHIARDGYGPTAGCVALRARDLKTLLRHLRPDTRIHIHF
jgi:L,D-peptidoglycan transpeptidase YkuD (ErfK/YbiS/YcfS/YnhG family)